MRPPGERCKLRAAVVDERTKHCLAMLHQAREFARYNPHDAIARIDALLHEIEIARASDPAAATALAPLREQARSARAGYVADLARFNAACEERARAYHERIKHEIEAPKR